MPTLFPRFAIVCLLGQAALTTGSLFGQGSLTPPGAPAPTMKTLTQVEPRTVIDPAASGFATPYTISQPGSYYLAGNITVANGGSAIVIASDNVSLDLNGFALISTSNPAAGSGILASASGFTNIQIRNGHIRGQATYTGSAIGGPGFQSGVNLGTCSGRVSDLGVSGVITGGIVLSNYTAALVERCTVTAARNPITAATVTHCHVTVGDGVGISAQTVADCGVSMISNASYGINATNVQNCSADCDGGTGISALVVNNCTASGVNGIIALSAAMNCYGTSTTGMGLFSKAATNCHGDSSSGTGLIADAANNCVASSTYGVGLNAKFTATNCRAFSTSGNGMNVTGQATGCSGVTNSASAIGLNVTGTANTCIGTNNAGGSAVALKANTGIGCTVTAGVTSIPAAGKFLGTP